MTHAALAAFIADGHYAAHIRRMRMLYGRRRAMLVNLIERRLGADWLHRDASLAGLHLVLTLPRHGRPARGRGARARRADASAVALLRRPGAAASGAAAGVACVPEQDIARKFEVLLDSLAEVARKPARAARA